MRTGRTRGTLLSRLEQLEVRTIGLQQVKVRFGKLRRLPEDYKGERHVIVAKQLASQNGQECVEFEEIAGPDPNPPQEPNRRGSVPSHIDVLLVAPYPRADDARPTLASPRWISRRCPYRCGRCGSTL